MKPDLSESIQRHVTKATPPRREKKWPLWKTVLFVVGTCAFAWWIVVDLVS